MAKAKSTAVVKSTKLRPGDYVTRDDRVFLRILGTIDSDLGPTYACLCPKCADIHWYSQYEMDSDGMTKAEPDLAAYQALRSGDIIHCGHSDDRGYRTVLARAGDAILLSQEPNKHLAQALLKVDKMLKAEMADSDLQLSDILGKDEMHRLKKLGSSLHAAKIAGDWYSVEKLALYNWPIVSE